MIRLRRRRNRGRTFLVKLLGSVEAIHYQGGKKWCPHTKKIVTRLGKGKEQIVACYETERKNKPPPSGSERKLQTLNGGDTVEKDIYVKGDEVGAST